jgi:hypothetical protein
MSLLKFNFVACCQEFEEYYPVVVIVRESIELFLFMAYFRQFSFWSRNRYSFYRIKLSLITIRRLMRLK